MPSHLRILKTTAIMLSIMAVLLCVQSGSASYRRFRDFDLNAMYLGPACTDGVVIGLKNEQKPDRLELRKLEIHAAIASGDTLLGETHIFTSSCGLRDLVGYSLRVTAYGLGGSIQTREWPTELARSSGDPTGV